MLVTAWKILNSPDWKLEKQLDNGDRVQVKQVNGKRVFRLTVSIEIVVLKMGTCGCCRAT